MNNNQAIALLGSTGSIGCQTLEVAKSLGIRVLSLSAHKNLTLLEEQTRRFLPVVVAVYDEKSASDFKVRVADLDVKVVSGSEGLIEAATVEGASTVITAVVGMIGLLPTLAAIKLGRRIGLANKETLVCAGQLVMKAAKEADCEIIPVDSEHSAIFQCLNGENRGDVKSLILTASGGTFRGKKRHELIDVTPEMALRHPNWSMGQKITIDSSTLMNKGLEVIEAVHLFDIAPSNIQVVIHPQSIIHSMVEFSDSSIIAQLSEPDMRLPIAYALTYPERKPSLTPALDFSTLSTLTFELPDLIAFPSLDLAFKTAEIGGTACAVLNGANEVAVEKFLQGKLSFYGIYEAVSGALSHVKNKENPTLEDILEADRQARDFVSKN